MSDYTYLIVLVTVLYFNSYLPDLFISKKNIGTYNFLLSSKRTNYLFFKIKLDTTFL